MESGREKSSDKTMPTTYDAWPSWWRTKIGLILPSVDLETPSEFQMIVPRGVALLHTRIMLKETTPEQLRKSGEEVLYSAELLATTNPDVVSYNCTSGVMIRGPEYEQELMQKIEEVSGAKATSMALSIVKAFESLGVKRFLAVSPYLDEIVEAEKRYFKSFGYETALSESMKIPYPLTVMARSPWENYRFTLDAYAKAPDVDAILIACGALRTFEIIEALEEATGKPVVSSNLCSAWMCLKLGGIKNPIQGFGSLLARAR
jgi:maleate isomerase